MRGLIRQVTTDREAHALLLGGTDSAILGWGKPLPSYTVFMGRDSEDSRCSGQVVEMLRLKWIPIEITQETAMDVLKILVKINHSYDLVLLNDIAPFVAIERAVKDGARVVRSGQDPEIIFQGYEHLIGYENVTAEIDKLSFGYYRQPLDTLEAHFSVKIDRPYLDPRILDFARMLRRKDNVADNAPIYGSFVQELHGGKKYITKLTLRRTMVGILPVQLAFRPMSDLEYGSGTYRLESRLVDISGPETIEQLNSAGRPLFRNKAHHGMYVLFKEAGLSIITPNVDEYACRSCGGGVPKETEHCYTCGADPARIPLWASRE